MATRRTFLQTSAALLAAGLLPRRILAQPKPAEAKKNKDIPPKPPSLDPEKVRGIVGAAHGNLEKVRSYVAENPLLVNACWDWGGGDFETPLQAAAHMGHRHIAEYLLSQNARFDIYAAAMLGLLEIVQNVLAVDPVTLADVPGPHGLTLLHCANQGGEKARPVYDWLVAQGVPEVMSRPLPFFWPESNSTTS